MGGMTTHQHHRIDYIELGLNPQVTPGRGGALVLLFSTDLDATVAAVTSAGGEVVEGPYEFPGGRRFHFVDPSGNELGVWSEQ